MNDDEVEPSRLLARKRGPSILEKEEMFDRIAARVDAERRPRRRLASWAAALSAAALLGGLVIALGGNHLRVRPGEPEGASPAGEPEFAARGAASALELRCEPSPCTQESRMLFRVTAPPEKPNLALFARGSDGTVLWYLPAPDGRMAAAPRGEWLPQAVPLKEKHRPGKYTVYAAFAAAPLDRDALKAELREGLRSTPNVVLAERALVIEGSP